LRLVDTHCHLADDAFAGELEAVLDRARTAGVVAFVAIPVDVASSREVVALAGRHPDVWAAVGGHPNECPSLPRPGFDPVGRLAEHPRVVAIGETGLDYYRDRASREQQRTILRWHVELGQRLGKPIVVHNREADADLATELSTLYRAAPATARSGVL